MEPTPPTLITLPSSIFAYPPNTHAREMEATHTSLRQVFEKTMLSQEEDFGAVMKRAMSMSRHPTHEDTLCELSRTEIVCLMAITSLGMVDVKMSTTMIRAVEEWKVFPRLSAYFCGKLRVDYNLPKEFLVRALRFGLYGKKLGFLSVPPALVDFIRVLISEAQEPSPTNEVSSHRRNKTHKKKAASRTSAGPSSRSDRPPTPPIARPCSPPGSLPTRPSAKASQPSNRSITPSTAKTPPPSDRRLSPPSAKPASPQSAKPNPTPDPQKSAQVPEDRERATRELWEAVRGDDGPGVEAALVAGGDVRAKDGEGDTPLHVAAWGGREGAVRYLIAHRAEVEVEGEYGYKPLHCAARSGSVGCVSALLDAGAGINTKAGLEQWTPLHYAAWCGRLPCSKLLVKRGADLKARSRNGRTPLAVAVDRKHHTVQQYLKSVGGTI